MTYDVEASCDFETRSDVDLKKHGPARYFASPHWKALILKYRIKDRPLAPMRQWTCFDSTDCPADLAEHIRRGGFIRGFGAQFERQCFDELSARFDWPRPAVDRYRCTAVEAAAMALPRSLEGVGAALGLPVQKDARGKELIEFFSMPRRIPAKERDARAKTMPPSQAAAFKAAWKAKTLLEFNEPADHPEKFQQFIDYCHDDVLTEEGAAARIYSLRSEDQDMYILDQVINSRGMKIDLPAVRAALAMAEKAKGKLEAELAQLTGGAVTGVNQAKEMSAWLTRRGLPTESVAKDVVADLLEKIDLPEDVECVLHIRQEGAKSSTAKFEAFLDRASADGRVRHAFVFNAAGPGRWSSRGVQLHNLPRPRKIFGDAHLDLDTLFDVIGTADPDAIEWMYGPQLGQPLPILSDALKSFIIAEEGHDIVEVDYSGIQSANAAWLSDETWKLEAMREIIADKSKPDLYRCAAAGILGTTTEEITKAHPMRQAVGKTSELSMQFEGGVTALHNMCRVYSVKMHSFFAPVWAASSEERRERAVKRYEKCFKRREAKADVLPRESWIAGELVKIGWRESHPAHNSAWGLLRDAIRDAVQNPGTRVSVLKVSYLTANGFLWCRLPSGRVMAYPEPRLRAMSWFKEKITGESEVIPSDQAFARQKAGEGEIRGNASPSVTVLGVDSQTNRFIRYGLYGGLAFQNIVMAIEVDILRHGLKAAERAGYPAIGHIHDAGIFEPRKGFGSLAELSAIMCDLPACYATLPLAAAGYRGSRLKKD